MPRDIYQPGVFCKIYKNPPVVAPGGFLYANNLKAIWKPNLPGGCVPSW